MRTIGLVLPSSQFNWQRRLLRQGRCALVRFHFDKILIVTKILVKLNLSIFGELSGHSNGPLFDTGFQVATTAGWGLLGYKQGLSSELRSLSLTITTV